MVASLNEDSLCMFLSIAAFKVRLGSLNEIAINFALTVWIRRYMTPLIYDLPPYIKLN